MRTSATLLLFGLLLVLSAQAQVPVAVVNAASYQAKFPVAPGSWAAVFPVPGQSFVGVPTATAAIPFPTILSQTQVFVNEVAAPLWFVSSAQINFQVPRATPVGKVPIRVVLNGQNVGTGNMDVGAAAPGIFVIDLLDPNQPGAVVNADGNVNGPARRISRGGIIQVFGTGQGNALDAVVADGQPANAEVHITAPVKAYVSIEEAIVEYKGLAPTIPGDFQINIRIPDKPYIKGQVPLFVEINGIVSNLVSFWVVD